jgi:hypothetical protein
MLLSIAAFGFDGWRDHKEIPDEKRSGFGGEIAFASEMLRVGTEKPSGKLCGCESSLFEAEVLPFCLGVRMRNHLRFTNRQDIVHPLQMHHFSI